MFDLPAILAFFAKNSRWFGLAGCLIALLALSYCKGRHDGTRIEAAAWTSKVAQIRRERDAAALKAQTTDAKLKALSEAKIASDRKELDDATKDIPDQALSARQRARACIELRRQGRGCAASASPAH